MGLGPITERVRFDHGAATELSRACRAAATTIETQTASRAGWVSTAKEDFSGYFSELFARNQENAKRDSAEIATRLRDVARFTDLLATEAEQEQQRRDDAAAWKREQDDRGLLEKGWDWLTDGNDAPVPDMPEPSSFQATAIPPQPRETPRPGSGGGSSSSGTSSARPSDLRSFGNGSRGANESLSGQPTSCLSAYNTFVAGCGWGTLSADDVFASFSQLLEANREDVRWIDAIAEAFERAGSDGTVPTLPNSALTAALQARDIDASRQDIDVDPPQALGNPPTSGYTDDPVNAATGNFIENEVDLAFPGGSASLALTRTYNSFDDGVGAFGPGWSSWTEAGLEVSDESARMRLEDGRVVVFPRQGDGWDRATGESRWLVREGQHLVATTNDGERRVHSADGRLVEVSRGTGITFRLSYDESARLVRLDHVRGRSIELTWSDEWPEGRVVEARTSDGRTSTYTYDDAGQLVGVTTGGGTRTYHWTDASGGPGLISAVVDPDGVVEAENTYDDRARVTAQRSAHGRISRYVYLDGNVTVVSDPDGNRSNTWISDQRGRLIGAVDSDEQRQSFAYDTHGNRVMVTERDGSVTVREYDDRGRLVREVTPSGADLTYGYDAHDRVTTLVTETGAVTEYAYDDDTGDQRNPTVLTDPEGGRTEMSWRDGLLTQVTDPVGVTVSFDYDEHGDLISTTDALGHTARLERDAQGRVVAAITPLGHRTSFVYSPSGALASRRDPDGAVWRYEHTTGGRLTATVDPTGARTEVEHNDAGDAARTIDPLGRSITRHFDDLGNLASVELPDGSTWRYTHDAMSRLVETTDPSGGTWSQEHDLNGMVKAAVDPTGVRRTMNRDRGSRTLTVEGSTCSQSVALDQLGRTVKAQGVDGSTAMWVHDGCGRPVEQLDAAGGLTRIERDLAGRVVRIVSPAGGTTEHEYDATGRLAAVIDPVGARTTREYDADGRLTSSTLPTGDVVRIDYDANGRIVATRRPGRGISHFRYDAAGRVVESSDTWNGRRKFRYDAAGQIVEVTDGNGGTTRYEYDAAGHPVAMTDPLGHTTRREFDPVGRCVALTDPLGRTTRARYDAAGRITWHQDPDGDVIEVGYDADGNDESLTLNGRLVSRIARDVHGRRATITDTTRPAPSTIELEWSRLGQLVRRARDGQAVTWDYDAEGRRVSMMTPDGTTTRYEHDPAGRVTSVEHPLLGRASFTRDAAGRVVEASAGGVFQTWEHTDGWVSAHTIGGSAGFTRTEIQRSDDGRISSLSTGGDRTDFDYDGACQLIAATSTGSVSRWRYDAAGRLVAETVDAVTVDHTYDAAGQLVTSTDHERTTTYAHDGVGRRIREESSDGMVRELQWSVNGWLTAVADRLPGGDHRETTLHVDATGQLAEVDGTAIHWDSAAFAPSPVQAGETSVLAAGPVTGIGDSWASSGWRSHRSTGADPWTAAGTTTGGDHGALVGGGLRVGADGGLTIAGMEWLGARVYDPASRGFLSVDPMEPTTGAGWVGNPYSYAGNDPMHALDPLGLQPLTDAELRDYNATHNGFSTMAATVWDRVTTKEFLLGAGLAALGAAAFFVPLPGMQIVGGMLLSAGADAMIQQVTTGKVDWKSVAISGAFGAFGGVGANLAVRAGAKSVLGRAVAGGAITGGAEGFTKGNIDYFTGDGPHTPMEYLRQVGGSTASSAATGAVTGPLEMRIDDFAIRRMIRNGAPTSPTPDLVDPSTLAPDPIPVIGNSGDVSVATGLDPSGHANAMGSEALREAIDYQRPVYLGSEPPGDFSPQMQMLQDAGYTRVGDEMVPGGG